MNFVSHNNVVEIKLIDVGSVLYEQAIIKNMNTITTNNDNNELKK